MTTAQVDFRTFGATEKLVEDGTGNASKKIMEIFLDYIKSNGFEDKTDNVKVLSIEDDILANSYIMRNFRPYAKISIKDSKEHGSFYIIVNDKDFARIILEHQDYIEKKLFGNNKVTIVDYEKIPNPRYSEEEIRKIINNPRVDHESLVYWCIRPEDPDGLIVPTDIRFNPLTINPEQRKSINFKVLNELWDEKMNERKSQSDKNCSPYELRPGW